MNSFISLFRKFKMAIILNVLGLSVSFAVFIIIGMQVSYDFSYNRNFQNIEDLHLFSRYYHFNGNRYNTINQDLPLKIKNDLPEVMDYCLIGWPNTSGVKRNIDDLNTFPMNIMETTPGFTGIISPQILSGNPAGIFDEKGKALISEKNAQILFGDEDPVGKTVYYGRDNQILTIQAVYKDFQENSDIKNGIYTYMVENTSNNWNYFGYFLLKPENTATVTEKMNGVDFIGEKNMQFYAENPENRMENEMIPLKDKYLFLTNSNGGKRITTTVSLLAIGVLIVMISLINLLNFSIAMGPARIKTINLRKILGAHKNGLRISISLEGVYMALIAFFLALVYVYLFSDSSLAQDFTSGVRFSGNIMLIIGLGVGFLFLTLLFGIYPAMYTTSFNEALALTGSFALSPKGVKLRNTLIVVQFLATIILISFAAFIRIQHSYMQNHSWGLQKENIVYLNLGEKKVDPKLFGEELLRNPDILDYTTSMNLPGRIGMSWSRNLDGKFIDYFTVWPVSPNFLDFFGVQVVAGNNFPEEETGTEKIIFNQEFVKKHELTEEIIGKEFFCFNDGEIVGISQDVNFESLHEPIKPMAFVVLNDKAYYNFFFVKISGNNTLSSLDYIRDTYAGMGGSAIDVRFLDENMDDLYKSESSMAKLIGLCGLVCVIVALMGIYGLVTFNIRYKTKEIGIRKVNGAREYEVMLMLNKDTLTLLLIAFLIAVFPSYYIMSKWLESFAYKTSIPWWLLPAVGILILLITVITISWQSYKAASANPVEAIKAE